MNEKHNMGEETNVLCEQYELLPEQKEFFTDYDWWFEVFGNLPIEMIGVFLNSIALLVLLTSSMRSNFFNRLLSVLAIFDTIYLLCEISEVLRHQYRTYEQIYACIYLTYPLRHVPMCSSIFMTIALSFERYQALTNPVEYRNRVSTNMTRGLLYYVLPILAFSTLYYVPKLLELNVDEFVSCINGTVIPLREVLHTESTQLDNCTREYQLIPTELRMDHYYVLWYINVSNIMLTAIMPIFTLGYLNFKIHASLKIFMKRRLVAGRERSNQDNDVKRTFIQLSIVVIFVLCHTLRIVLNIDQFINLNKFKEIHEKGCYQADRVWFRVVAPISQFLILINSSGNFFIYLFFDPIFRKNLQQVWICIKNMTKGNGENEDGRRGDSHRRDIESKLDPSENIELSNMNHI